MKDLMNMWIYHSIFILFLIKLFITQSKKGKELHRKILIIFVFGWYLVVLGDFLASKYL